MSGLLIRPSRLLSRPLRSTTHTCGLPQHITSRLSLTSLSLGSLSANPRTLYTTQFRQARSTIEDKDYERYASEMGSLDVLGNLPVPGSSVTTCTPRGFKLHNGKMADNGDAIMMFSDHVVRWRPWEHEKIGGHMRILNDKGQLDLPEEVFGVFEVMWPRPDMLIIGSGPSIAPMSPAMRDVFVRLGMRVDVLDTRNAAAQYNLLATERGVEAIAAALFPMGWKDGFGAENA